MIILSLAQADPSLGIFQTILEGGLPLALLIALYVLFSLYNKERAAKDVEVSARIAATENHSKEMAVLRSAYSDKVEQLLRERLESEASSQRVIIEAKEVMQSAVMQMSSLGDLIEAVERETN